MRLSFIYFRLIVLPFVFICSKILQYLLIIKELFAFFRRKRSSNRNDYTTQIHPIATFINYKKKNVKGNTTNSKLETALWLYFGFIKNLPRTQLPETPEYFVVYHKWVPQGYENRTHQAQG